MMKKLLCVIGIFSLMEGATPLLKRRLSYKDTLEQKLFVLMILGDDRSVVTTYVDGALVYYP